MAVFWFLLVLALALVIAGLTIKGFLYLIAIAAVLLLIDFLVSGIRLGRRRRTRMTR